MPASNFSPTDKVDDGDEAGGEDGSGTLIFTDLGRLAAVPGPHLLPEPRGFVPLPNAPTPPILPAATLFIHKTKTVPETDHVGQDLPTSKNHNLLSKHRFLR